MPRPLMQLVTDVSPLPPEGPGDFVRNALQLLVAHETQHPAVWEFSPELRRIEALLFRAAYALDGAP